MPSRDVSWLLGRASLLGVSGLGDALIKDIFGQEKIGYELPEIRAMWLYILFEKKPDLYWAVKGLFDSVDDFLIYKYPTTRWTEYAYDISNIILSVRDPDTVSSLCAEEIALRDALKIWIEMSGICPRQPCVAWIARTVMGMCQIDFKQFGYEYIYFQVFKSMFVRYHDQDYEDNSWSLELEFGKSKKIFGVPEGPKPPVAAPYHGRDRKQYEAQHIKDMKQYLDDYDKHLEESRAYRSKIIKSDLARDLNWLMWAIIENLSDDEVAFKWADLKSLPEGIDEKTVYTALWGQSRGVAQMVGFVKKNQAGR